MGERPRPSGRPYRLLGLAINAKAFAVNDTPTVILLIIRGHRRAHCYHH